MMVFTKNFLLSILIFFFFIFPPLAGAQSVNVNASRLLAHVELKLSPRSGSFEEGSTFQVPILLNTKGSSINGIEVRINFDKDKLTIVNPTGGTSIIGVWVEPPKFDNTRGTASYVGVVPNGIVTEAGLIGTITFQAKAPGNAGVSFSTASKVLLNDGLGTAAQVDFGRADYTILVKAPEGVQIFSETHPIQSDWYNNNTPVISWIKDEGVTGFSFEMDNKPNTIPDNVIDTVETTKTFTVLNDGLSYFHIKANKGEAWGTTGHFLIRIDTTPPAEFTPQTNYLVAAVVLAERTLVSFFTTDNLSGVDHYEVGVIDKSQPLTESPVFIQSESPFQVPLSKNGSLEVIVRAIDKAGNVRDESIPVRMPFVVAKFFGDNIVYILIGIIILIFLILILHHLMVRRRRSRMPQARPEAPRDYSPVYSPPPAPIIFSTPPPIITPDPVPAPVIIKPAAPVPVYSPVIPSTPPVAPIPRMPTPPPNFSPRVATAVFPKPISSFPSYIEESPTYPPIINPNPPLIPATPRDISHYSDLHSLDQNNNPS